MGLHFNLNLDRIPKELKLILKLLENESNPFIGPNELYEVDWTLFLELAFHHRVYPLLFHKIKSIDKNKIPPTIIQSLSHAYQRNIFEMLRLSGEMEQLSKTLNENHVRSIVLKGPVLAKDLYGDLSLRTCGDLDILVSIKDLEKVDKILQSQGYTKSDYINTSLTDWKWRNHHIEYFHHKKRVNVEIHWRLNPFPGNGPNFEELWDRKRRSSLTNYPVYFLGQGDLFLFLVSHGARHGWFRLRWLVDINQMVAQTLDWNNLIKHLKRYQYFHVAGQAIILASDLLHLPIDNEMNKLVNRVSSQKLAQAAIFYLERMVNIHSEPVSKDVDEYHKRHLFCLMTKRQKCLYFISFLYPYPLDAETLPLPKPLHVLYFPLRPFLWMWRKTRKHALL